MNIFGLIPALFAPNALLAGFKSWQLGLRGNMFGDGWQNGGCLVVEKGGDGDDPLLYYIQESAPDHVSNDAVLKVRKKTPKTLQSGRYILQFFTNHFHH